MLLQLRIKNLATIRELEVEFEGGFSILTGETGAGKSIMIDAILLMLGQRGETGLIRTGEAQTVVEAIFALPQNFGDLRKTLEESGISLDDELIIRCVVPRKGRQKRHINGVSVTADFLKKIGRQLINIHGQHDHQSLLQVSSHLEFLDGFGRLFPLRQQVAEAYQSLQQARKDHKNLQKRLEYRTERMSQLNEIIDDLDELNLQDDEEHNLRKEENRLTHVEKLSMLLGKIRHELQERDGAILEQLELLRKLLGEAEAIDPECASMRSGTESALFQMEDTHQALMRYGNTVEDDPTRLAWINERLSRIQHFCRKYRRESGSEPYNELQKLLKDSRKELDALEHFEESESCNEQEICAKIERFRKQLRALSERLSVQRRKQAIKMDRAVVRELQQLGMEKARFETQIVSASFPENPEANLTANLTQWSPKGIDQVEFLLTVNPGQELRSLVKVASGGELSRIMLALKTVLTSLDTVEILIFDEVDTGISGRIAEIVGQKLRSLGERHQTLCVTHLPQIAAFAKQHYLISKHLGDKATYTAIAPLNTQEERVRALADLMGGQEITERTLGLASEMLRRSQKNN